MRIIQAVVISSLIILVLFCQSSFAEGKDHENVVVTLKIMQKPLRDVVNIVAKETRYRIEISEALLDVSVSGNFKNIQVENLFRRILRGKNLFFVGDVDKKSLKIFTSQREKGRVFVADATQGEHLKNSTYQAFLASRDKLDKQIQTGEVELRLESGESMSSFLATRDDFDERARTGELELELDSGVSLKKMTKERDAFDQKMNSGEIVPEVSPGNPLDKLVASRDKLDKQIRSGEVTVELDPGVSLAGLVVGRDSLDEKMRDGSVELNLEQPLPKE